MNCDLPNVVDAEPVSAVSAYVVSGQPIYQIQFLNSCLETWNDSEDDEECHSIDCKVIERIYKVNENDTTEHKSLKDILCKIEITRGELDFINFIYEKKYACGGSLTDRYFVLNIQQLA